MMVVMVVACFAPSLVFLGFYALKERDQPEPLRLLIGVFAAGILAAPIAIVGFELLAVLDFYGMLEMAHEAPESTIFAYSVFAIGPLEELLKFVAVWATVYRFRAISAPIDGIVYSSAAAVGFAAYENWFAMNLMGEVIWSRALTLPFIHALFSSFWGYAVGIERFGPRGVSAGRTLVIVGLVLGMVYHGFYNYILLSPRVPELLVVPLVFVLWVWTQFAIRQLLRGELSRT